MPLEPMVSIIIPAYNVEQYIEECLASALGQSFAEIEVIVVNDGSTDRTLPLIKKYAATDSRLQLIDLGVNQGQSVARNAGIGKASGEWLVFLDADDILAPNSVSILYETAISLGADIVSGDYIRRLPFPVQRKPAIKKIISGSEALIDILYQETIEPSPWAKIFRRSLFSDKGFREGIIYEDLDIVDSLYPKANKVVTIDSVCFFYRPNPLSTLGQFKPKRFDVLDVTERIEKWAATQPSDELQKAAADRRLSANFNILGLLASSSALETYPEVADKCWDIIKERRLKSLFNKRVRLKNKVGILVSFFGKRILTSVLGRHYR